MQSAWTERQLLSSGQRARLQSSWVRMGRGWGGTKILLGEVGIQLEKETDRDTQRERERDGDRGKEGSEHARWLRSHTFSGESCAEGWRILCTHIRVNSYQTLLLVPKADMSGQSAASTLISSSAPGRQEQSITDVQTCQTVSRWLLAFGFCM